MELHSYTKRPLWQRLLCYVIIGGILYAGLYGLLRAARKQYATPQPIVEHPVSYAPVSPDLIGDSKQFALTMQNNSGQFGHAKFESWKDSVIVTISLSGAVPQNVAQPAHIYSGNCLHTGSVQYKLSPVVNGESITKLRVAFDAILKKFPLVIDVVKSSSESGMQTSCGGIE